MRDDDFVNHGHLTAAIRRPNDDFRPEQLVRDLKDIDVVVFYCFYCGTRGVYFVLFGKSGLTLTLETFATFLIT